MAEQPPAIQSLSTSQAPTLGGVPTSPSITHSSTSPILPSETPTTTHVTSPSASTSLLSDSTPALALTTPPQEPLLTSTSTEITSLTSTTETPTVPSDAASTTITAASSTSSEVSVTVTYTSTPLETSETSSSTAAGPSSSTSPVTVITTSEARSGESGAGHSLAKRVIAIAIPLIGVALITIVAIIWLRRRKRNTKRIGSGSDYGYVAGAAATGKSMPVTSSSEHIDDHYEATDSGEGYRGWGTTGGGRKISAIPLSSVEKPVSDSVHGGNDSFATASNPLPAPNPSSTTNLASSSAPAANASMLGATSSSKAPSNAVGLNRGISNASSNYSAISISDQSDSGNNRYSRYSVGGNPYAQEAQNPPPVIQDVQARRHTRIETPTGMHYPQQGNSGIAQNY